MKFFIYFCTLNRDKSNKKTKNESIMKKLISLLVLITAMAMSAAAQQHITFMKTPLTGTVKNFVSKMEYKGFEVDTRFDDGNVMMRGTFTNRDIELFIFGTPQTHTVYKVVVYYPKQKTWPKLKADYFDVKALYDRKYDLSNEYDFFADPYNEGDGDEMDGVENDKCRYASFYNAPGGMIAVQVSSFFQVKVTYEDEININLRDSEK